MVLGFSFRYFAIICFSRGLKKFSAVTSALQYYSVDFYLFFFFLSIQSEKNARYVTHRVGIVLIWIYFDVQYVFRESNLTRTKIMARFVSVMYTFLFLFFFRQSFGRPRNEKNCLTLWTVLHFRCNITYNIITYSTDPHVMCPYVS